MGTTVFKRFELWIAILILVSLLLGLLIVLQHSKIALVKVEAESLSGDIDVLQAQITDLNSKLKTLEQSLLREIEYIASSQIIMDLEAASPASVQE